MAIKFGFIMQHFPVWDKFLQVEKQLCKELFPVASIDTRKNGLLYLQIVLAVVLYYIFQLLQQNSRLFFHFEGTPYIVLNLFIFLGRGRG